MSYSPMVLDVRVMAGTGGGPEKTILRTPAYLDSARYRMAAAYIHPQGDPGIEAIGREAATLNCPLHTIAEAGPLDPRTPLTLLRLCRQLNVTVWHAHDYKSDVLGLMLRRLHPMKLVSTLHGWTDETARVRFYRRVDDWAIRHYDHVIAVSPPIAQRCRTIGIAPERLTVLPNGIDPAEFSPRRSRDEAKGALGIDPAARLIGVVGRLSPEKGVDRLLPVISDLALTVPRLRVAIIGDGPERVALESRRTKLGLSGIVHFRGWQRPMQAWYEAMDVLILPSRTEGVPNTALEAMAMSTPVAATDVGGVSDLLDHGRCGLLLPTDESTWAAAIAPLLTKPAVASAYTRAARARVEACFTFRGRIDRLMAIYDQLTANADKHKQPRSRAA